MKKQPITGNNRIKEVRLVEHAYTKSNIGN